MKSYYIAVEYYDKDGNRINRRFVNGRAFGCIFSFTTNVNEAKFFASLKAAKEYMKNYISPTQAKTFYEIMYSVV